MFKVVSIFATLAMSASTFASLGGVYCKMKMPVGHESLAKYAMKITETAELPEGDYDFRRKATVQMIREIRKNQTVIKEFEAVVESQDVHYFVDARKAEGFFFSLYLDDAKGTVTQTDSNGVASKSEYTCEPLK